MKKYFLAIVLLSFLKGYGQNVNGTVHAKYKMQPVVLQSRWAKQVSPASAHKEYPRPQMKRGPLQLPQRGSVQSWQNLNGLWDYAITKKDADWPTAFDGQILVPYPIESALSGVKRSLMPDQLLWYRRSFTVSGDRSLRSGQAVRYLLHFGAVDWQATVYVNGNEVGEHKGGYTAFSFDITDYLKKGNNELVVKVYDPTDRGYQPHGKQVLNPANIYYTPSSGIWQTVWMEVVPATYIKQLTITPDIDKAFVHVLAEIENESGSIQTEATVWFNGKLIANEKRSSNSTGLDIPNAKLWSPDEPNLYTLRVRLFKNSKLIDEVSSYFGMRKIEIKKDSEGFDRIFLNNKYTYNLGVLDQGFWPDGLYTAPTDEALAFDIKAIKAMGFNTIRKHIKVEPARWYYWADKLGVMVWQDFVNPNQSLPAGAKEEFEKESKEMMDQLQNHPSITTWVLFNERWGAYDQKRLTEWVKTYDPSRLVNGHTGELLYVNDRLGAPSKDPYVNSDMTDVHSYPDPMLPIKQEGKAMVVGEFGGVGVSVPFHQWNSVKGWGYVKATAEALRKKYEGMIAELKDFEDKGLSGSIYTQPFDVEGEENGLITYDREIVKIPVEEIRKINGRLLPSMIIEKNFNIGKNMDFVYRRYHESVQQFKNGKRDSAFLRNLIPVSTLLQDSMTAVFTKAYLKVLRQPVSLENLTFVWQITRTSGDTGFKWIKDNADKINKATSPDYAEGKLRSVIYNEILDSLRKKQVKDDYAAVEKYAIQTNGEIGERAVWNALADHAWEAQDVTHFVEYKNKLHAKYPQDVSNYFYVNNDAWFVFKASSNKKELESALAWQEEVIKNDKPNAEAYDTYANLLYKVGKKDEAINWEEKALKMDPTSEWKNNALEKMKKGEPTWPVK